MPLAGVYGQPAFGGRMAVGDERAGMSVRQATGLAVLLSAAFALVMVASAKVGPGRQGQAATFRQGQKTARHGAQIKAAVTVRW
jgi:hypothetical protein